LLKRELKICTEIQAKNDFCAIKKEMRQFFCVSIQ